jgi:hypothetical protein
MELKWMGFECEASLLAEVPETRQHFFLFLLSDFFAFGSEALSLVQAAGACQHFFLRFSVKFFNHESTRMGTNNFRHVKAFNG